MTILGLHHAQITVATGDEARARQFYCGVLGLPEIEKPRSLKDMGGFWVQVGDRAMHIGVEDNVDRSATKAHLAYQVDDVAAWRTKIRETGIATLDSIAIPGFDRFEFRDPFGNRVELIQVTRSR
jgi:catechol 2,3-dioxygenase-like lactoylglutathione lyase family enzyme